jgi:hypothetical protein
MSRSSAKSARRRSITLIALSCCALLLAASSLVGSCMRGPCNAIGCSSGLTVQLLGADRDGGIAAMPFQIAFAKLVNLQVIPLTTCTISSPDGLPDEVVCNPAVQPNFFGAGIHFDDTDIRVLRVTVSQNGTQLSQETYTPEYTSREVWGEGCGWCTQATVQVSLPSPA